MPRPAAPKIDVQVVKGGNRAELMSPQGGITAAWLRAVMSGQIEGVPRMPDHAVLTTENGHVSLTW
jgi:hypothetical protein